MIIATTKKVLMLSAVFALAMTGRQSQAALIPISLTPDAANSTGSGFNGSIAKTVNDPFAYNPNSPTSPLPDLSFSGGVSNSPGFHANVGSGVDVFLSYDFTDGPLTQHGPSQSFFVDLYGRSNCCTDRDDNIDIEVWSGGIGGTLLGTLTGVGIANGFPQHVRADLAPVLSTGMTFDAIRLVAHDSTAAAGNLFTLMEIRAAQIAVPEPASASLALVGLAGLMMRRRRLA